MISIESTILKYNNYVDSLTERKRFFHRKSICNFLIHFNEIKNENDKSEVLFLINEYLDYSLLNQDETLEECKEAFDKFINPIGMIYKRDAGFVLLFKNRLVIPLLIVLNIMLFVIYPNKTVIASLNLFGIGIICYLFKKSRTTRFFGIMW